MIIIMVTLGRNRYYTYLCIAVPKYSRASVFIC